MLPLTRRQQVISPTGAFIDLSVGEKPNFFWNNFYPCIFECRSKSKRRRTFEKLDVFLPCLCELRRTNLISHRLLPLKTQGDFLSGIRKKQIEEMVQKNCQTIECCKSTTMDLKHTFQRNLLFDGQSSIRFSCLILLFSKRLIAGFFLLNPCASHQRRASSPVHREQKDQEFIPI